MSLELKYVKLETLAQDGTVINEQEATADIPLASDYNMISERKRLTLMFNNNMDGYTLQTLEGALLYINFAMFLPIGFIYNEPSGPPQSGFNLKLPNTLSGSERLEMFFYSNGAITPNANKNLRCFFLGADDALEVTTEFGIELEFYNTYDEGTYFNNFDKNNQWRFLSEWFNQQNFNEKADSVFHIEKEIRAMVYLSSDSNTINTKQEFPLVQMQNKTFNVQSTWTFGDEGYTELSRTADTEVVVLLQSPLSISDFYVKIFKEKNDTSIDFISNNELQENKIDPSSIDNILKAPFEHTTVMIEGQVYHQLTFSVDHTLLEDGETYRMIAAGYEPYSEESIIGISPAISLTKYKPYSGDGITFRGSLSDIQREFFGDELTCVIEERIKTKMYLDYSYDSWKNSIISRLGLTNPSNDIREYLNFVKVEIYEEFYDINVAGTVVNILQQSTLSKIAQNSYSSPDMVTVFNTDNSEFELTFRNKNDVNGLPISSTVNGVPYYNPNYQIGNQYWGGKDLFIKWRFGFVYPQFQDNIDYIQKLHVKDYDENLTIARIGSTSYFVCDDDELCYRAEVTSGIPDYDSEQWLLINTIENVSLPILEEENFAGIELPQQSNSYIFDQDTLYHSPGVRGEWCIDPTNLLLNWDSKFSAMAKKNYTY